MCVIHKNTRPQGIMSLELFKEIIKKMLPYRGYFKYLTLHGCGEPLLDKTISEKVAYAKESQFKGIGFSTNCQALSAGISKKLLNSGLDTLIASVDGYTKEVQESIRVGTNFNAVLHNVRDYIRLRDELKRKGRILIRFIRQKANYDEWPDFKQYWDKYINKEKGDDVIKFDIHNCGDRITEYEKMKVIDVKIIEPCCDLYERLIVFTSGDYGFCSADQSGYFKLGNVVENDPIAVFNNEIFSKYRKQMAERNISLLEHCRDCSLPLSRHFKDKPVDQLSR
jgi:sulfatase maturation enzyme AslB (radical SAM superfamily)